jgi:regulator of sirC expression with transglutaminase-like and TPR domain
VDMFKRREDAPPPCRLAFAHLVRQPEAAIDLAEATLLIAKEEYPDLDLAGYLSRLDDMGADVRGLTGACQEPHRLIAGLSEYLFRRLGFHGNSDDYYDPKNSFLNEVLDRRMGIPITLSTVYLEVGRRIGLSVHGVGMPGHFLVKYMGQSEEIVIDPFGGGGIVSPADCQRILDRVYDGKVRFEPGMLSIMGTRQILARMLANLKIIYFNQEEYGKALSVVELLLILHPHNACEIRDRGLLSCQLRCYTEAIADLERYLRLAPEANDSATIREHLRTLRQRAAALN